MKPRFLEYGERQDLLQSVERGDQLKFFFKNGDEQVGGYIAPDLSLDCVLAFAQKLLDAEVLGAVLCNVVPVQRNGLIADDAACPVHLGRVRAPGVHVAFGAGQKECACLMHLEQESKVYVASVHHINATGSKTKISRTLTSCILSSLM